MWECEGVRVWDAALKQNIGTGPLNFTFENLKKSMKDATENNIFENDVGVV